MYKEYSEKYPQLKELVKILNKYKKLYPTPKKYISFVHGLHTFQPAHRIAYNSNDRWTITIDLQGKWDNAGYKAIVSYIDMHKDGPIYLIKEKQYANIDAFFKDLIIVSEFIKKYQKKNGNSLNYDALVNHVYPISGI